MRRVLLLLATCLTVCAVGGSIVTDRALRASRRRALPATARRDAQRLVADGGGRLTPVSIAASDGVVLHGWHLAPSRDTVTVPGAAVLLLHGIGSTRHGTLPVAGLLLAHGYQVLLVDLRAHGESGGDLVTFGARETDDTRRWLAWMTRTLAPGCLYLYGGSLGAGIALQARDTPGLCGVVAESPFASAREITYDRLGQHVGTGAWLGRTLLRPAIESGILYARLVLAVNLDSASALAAMARDGAPVLLVHGTADTNIPVRHTTQLAGASRGPVVTWLMPGGGHTGALRLDPAGFRLRVIGFLRAHQVRWTGPTSAP